jgi:hypothetical protein
MLTGITSTLHEDQYTFFIISRSLFFRRINFSGKSSRENQNTYFLSNQFFENYFVYEIMWKNTVEPGRSQKKIWRKRIACWMTKAKNTNLDYVIFTVAFPLQQWLYERVSMLLLYEKCLLEASLELRNFEQISFANCAEMLVQSVLYRNFCPIRTKKKEMNSLSYCSYMLQYHFFIHESAE